MKSKPLTVLPLAERDVRNAVLYYNTEADAAVAVRFIRALETRYRSISRFPATGSTRFGVDLSIEGLRSVGLARFPYLIFFVEHERHIEVWRVLHTSRDIPATIQN